MKKRILFWLFATALVAFAETFKPWWAPLPLSTFFWRNYTAALVGLLYCCSNIMRAFRYPETIRPLHERTNFDFRYLTIITGLTVFGKFSGLEHISYVLMIQMSSMALGFSLGHPLGLYIARMNLFELCAEFVGFKPERKKLLIANLNLFEKERTLSPKGHPLLEKDYVDYVAILSSSDVMSAAGDDIAVQQGLSYILLSMRRCRRDHEEVTRKTRLCIKNPNDKTLETEVRALEASVKINWPLKRVE